MKIAGHPYSPNGLRAVDENGNVRCWCGHLRGVHADSQRTPERPRRQRSVTTSGIKWARPEEVPGAILSPEVERRLMEKLRAIDEAQARAMVSARNYVIYR